MVIAHNFYLRRRILRLIALKHDPTVALGYKHLTTTDAGTVGCMLPPDMPVQLSLRQVLR
jgi:hypothetical protein